MLPYFRNLGRIDNLKEHSLPIHRSTAVEPTVLDHQAVSDSNRSVKLQTSANGDIELSPNSTSDDNTETQPA